MTDLVVASLEAWDAVWRRNQHLVSRLLRDDPDLRVLFVEPPADPMHALRRRTAPRRGAGLRAAPSLPGIESGRLMLFQPTKAAAATGRPVGRPAARRPGQARGARAAACRTPSCGSTTPAPPPCSSAAGGAPSTTSRTTGCTRAHSEAEHERLTRHESLLLDRAAHVVVCSPALLASKGIDRGPASIIVGAQRRRPRRLRRSRAATRRPASRPRRPLRRHGASRPGGRRAVRPAPQRSWPGEPPSSCVGPTLVDETDRRAPPMRPESACSGPRDHSDVPRYLTHADVLLVPHVVTAFTESLDPIKLYEYRAASRPVVSTPVAGFRDAVDPLLTVASAATYPRAVRDALDRPDDAVRPAGRRAHLGRAGRRDGSGDRPGRHQPTRAGLSHGGHRARLPHPARRRGARRAGDASSLPGCHHLHDPLQPGDHVPGVPRRPHRHLGPQPCRAAASPPPRRSAAPALRLSLPSHRRGRRRLLQQRMGARLHRVRSPPRLLSRAGSLALPDRCLPRGRTRTVRRRMGARACWPRGCGGGTTVMPWPQTAISPTRGWCATGSGTPTAWRPPWFRLPTRWTPARSRRRCPRWRRGPARGGYYLVVSRLLPYKNVDAVVEAFRGLDRAARRRRRRSPQTDTREDPSRQRAAGLEPHGPSAALDVCALPSAGRPEPGGLRPHAPRSSRIRQADPRARRRRLPRHRRAGRDGELLRRADSCGHPGGRARPA